MTKAPKLKDPEKIPYQKNTLKIPTYGRYIERFIEQALALGNQKEEQEALMRTIIRLMKTFDQVWQGKSHDDPSTSSILVMIKKVAGDALVVDLEKLTLEEKAMPTKNSRSYLRPRRDRDHENTSHAFRNTKKQSSKGAASKGASNARNGKHHRYSK